MNAKIDISNTILKTDSLILRPFKISDLDDFYEYASVEGVGEMAGWLPHKNKKESEQILNLFISGKKTFAIEYNKKVIGSLGIEEYDEELIPSLKMKMGRELGFVLSKNYWGQGLMTEAVLKVIEYCFNTLELDFLVCSHFIDNYRSKRVQEKCGFKYYQEIKYKTRYNVIKDAYLQILENDKNVRKGVNE